MWLIYRVGLKIVEPQKASDDLPRSQQLWLDRIGAGGGAIHLEGGIVVSARAICAAASLKAIQLAAALLIVSPEEVSQATILE